MRRKFLDIDLGLIIPVFVLVVLSLTTLFTIDISIFRAQFFFLILSFLVFLFFSQLNDTTLRLYAVPLYGISLFFLLMVVILGIESRGAVRWLDFFGLRIQFSEILKPFLAISLSSFLAGNKISFKIFFKVLLFLFPVLLLIFLQPDLGNTLIYLGVVVFILIIIGFPIFYFALGLLPLIIVVPFGWRFLYAYQRDRLLTFIHPTNDPLGTSYNAIQSVIAVGSGMLLGKGLNETTQSSLRFLPERHTDFIFATMTEGFGFIGGLIVFMAFGFFLYKIFSIFVQSDDRFCKIFSVCSFSVILIQLFINIGMNIGILPIAGITLPFVSYGGSSLLSNFIFLGLLSSMSRTLKREEALEIK